MHEGLAASAASCLTPLGRAMLVRMHLTSARAGTNTDALPAQHRSRSLVFEQQWRGIERLLHRRLQARGVPRWVRDDIVQETATRIWDGWDDFDVPGDLAPLATTVANNLAIDHHRSAAKVTLTDQPPDYGTPPTTVEAAALARLDLDRVRVASSRLIPRYRQVLAAEVGEAQLQTLSPTVAKVTRNRARRRLSALMRQGCAVRLGNLVSKSIARTRQAAANAGAPAGLGFLQAALGLAVVLSVLSPTTVTPALPYGNPETFGPERRSRLTELAGTSAARPGSAASRSRAVWQSGTPAGSPPRASHAQGLPFFDRPIATVVQDRTGGRVSDAGGVGLDGATGHGYGNQPVAGESVSWSYRYRATLAECAVTHAPPSCDPARVRLEISAGYGDREVTVQAQDP